MTPDIKSAAAWLITERDRSTQSKIIPTLCRQFGLTAAQAIDAIREANRMRHQVKDTLQ